MYNIDCRVPSRTRSDIKIYLQTDAGNMAMGMSRSNCLPFVLRDWSLITGRGATKQGGGASEVLPLRKEEGQKKF